jgi:hypothetical protein
VRFETWIVERTAGRFNRAGIDRFSKVVETRVHSRPHKVVETYADIGYDLDTHTEINALLLNTLQDWQLFHTTDFASGNVPAGIPPLISSLDVGPLDVVQLPRMWHKVLLEAKGLLNADYPDCGGGLDQKVLDALGLNREKTLTYLRETLPSYVRFESWVIAEVREIDRAAVESFRAALIQREHPDPKLTDIHDRTGCDRSIPNGALLNHLGDWRYAYDLLIALEN